MSTSTSGTGSGTSPPAPSISPPPRRPSPCSVDAGDRGHAPAGPHRVERPGRPVRQRREHPAPDARAGQLVRAEMSQREER
jgi:hypothetical protein